MKHALVVMLAALACGPNVAVDDDDGADGTSTQTSATETTSTMPNPTDSTDPTDTTVSTTATSSPTTATSTDTFEESSEGGFDTGITFITGADAGHGCGQCDVWEQDCARGSKCMPWDCNIEPIWIALGCRELDPNPVAVGQPCSTLETPHSGLDNCDATAMCWDVDIATLEGECVAFCSGSEENASCPGDPSDSCFIGFNGLVPVCVPRCQPLAPSCADDEACVHNLDNDAAQDFVCVPDELVTGHAYGDDCSESILCDDGLVCRAATHVPDCAGGRCCTTLGRLSAPPACPDDTQTCVPLYDGDAPAGYEDLCFCGVSA